MSKIRILAIPPDTHGVGKYRFFNPYVNLQENHSESFHVTIDMKIEDNDKSFDGYDIVVFHTMIHQDKPFQRTLDRVEWLKKKGVIVVMDSDDYWELDMRHPMFEQIRQTDVSKNKINAMKMADYLTVTTPTYKKTIEKKLGKSRVYVLPNAVDEKEPQFVPKPVKSERIRFGWLGGSSHLHDIELLRNGISTFLPTYKNQTQFVLCGFDLRGNITEINKTTGEKRVRPVKPEETVWYLYENIFTDGYKHLSPSYAQYLKKYIKLEYDDRDESYSRKWTEPINTYASNYNHIDVSLAPLVPTLFNNNKSQLKAIEAGFHKKLLIASETEPYTLDLVSAIDKGGIINPKGNCLLVSPDKNHKGWFQHMKRIVDNPNMIEDLGNKLYETMKEKYSLNKVTDGLAEFLKSIITKQRQ